MNAVHHTSVDNLQRLLKALRDRSAPLVPDNIELRVMQCSPTPRQEDIRKIVRGNIDAFHAQERARPVPCRSLQFATNKRPCAVLKSDQPTLAAPYTITTISFTNSKRMGTDIVSDYMLCSPQHWRLGCVFQTSVKIHRALQRTGFNLLCLLAF